MESKKLRYKIENLLITILLVGFAVLCIYPLLYVLFASFSDPEELTVHTGLLIHSLGFSTKGYKLLLSTTDVVGGYANSLFVVIVGVTLNIFCSLTTAYVLSRKQLYLHKFLNKMVIITMYFSGGMIPTFLVVKSLGLLDSRWALIFPVLINTYNMIILKTAIEGLPTDLIEAAKIDGAGEFTLLVKIIIPLVKPTLAVLVLYYAVEHWNSWFNAMLYIRDRNKYPLQLLLREILVGTDSISSSMGGDMDKYGSIIKYCASMAGALPIMLLFPFLSKYFTKGVMMGAVKE